MLTSKLLALTNITRKQARDTAVGTESAGLRPELRGAMRFPLSLPVALETPQCGIAAITRNISTSGVLFELRKRLKEGTKIRYSLRMPAGDWERRVTCWFIAPGVWYAAP